MEVARAAGFAAGARLPGTLYDCHTPLAFADQDWNAYQKALRKSPEAARRKRAAYMRAVASARPRMASVLDWEYEEQLGEILEWAHEIAPYVERIMLIPKVVKRVDRLPNEIAGKPVVLGYSIPTTHGGTKCGLREFDGRRVHLLGGSPRAQLQAARLLREKAPTATLVSADGNMHHKSAGKGTYWDGRNWKNSGVNVTPTLEAFRRSCEAIVTGWGET